MLNDPRHVREDVFDALHIPDHAAAHQAVEDRERRVRDELAGWHVEGLTGLEQNQFDSAGVWLPMRSVASEGVLLVLGERVLVDEPGLETGDALDVRAVQDVDVPAREGSPLGVEAEFQAGLEVDGGSEEGRAALRFASIGFRDAIRLRLVGRHLFEGRLGAVAEDGQNLVAETVVGFLNEVVHAHRETVARVDRLGFETEKVERRIVLGQ